MAIMVGERRTLPAISDVGRSPLTLYDYAGLEHRIDGCAQAAKTRGFTLAYSVKTNPAPEVLRRMRAAGLCAEAISGAEVQAASEAGFSIDRIVLGGPGKTWPTGTIPNGLLALLDDTLEDFQKAQQRDEGHRYHCLRLRFPGVSSRFGVDTADIEQRRLVARELLRASAAGAAVGIATHQRSSFQSSADRWLASVKRLLEQLEDAHHGVLAVLEALDLGGGFDAQGLDALLVGGTGDALLAFVRQRLPHCGRVILEPGRSLVQAYGMVASSVIAKVSDREVIVDASFAELPWPMHATRPVYAHRRSRWQRLSLGAGILAGRSCMETDVLASNVDVSRLRRGDLVLFAEAGAYDVSMRNYFGAGKTLEI